MQKLLFWLAVFLAAALPAQAGDWPLRYFAGRTVSHGELRLFGHPRAFVTKATGTQAGTHLFLRQHFRFADGREQDRLWTLRAAGDGSIAARANDSVGRPQGEIEGNTFHFRYRIQAVPGNRFSVLSFEQWMTLRPDGRTLENRGIIRKFGRAHRLRAGDLS